MLKLYLRQLQDQIYRTKFSETVVKELYCRQKTRIRSYVDIYLNQPYYGKSVSFHLSNAGYWDISGGLLSKSKLKTHSLPLMNT